MVKYLVSIELFWDGNQASVGVLICDSLMPLFTSSLIISESWTAKLLLNGRELYMMF